MNYFYLIAGVVSLSATIGHFVMGTGSFLKPVLNSEIDIVPKKVMQSIFHYMSVYMILTTAILLMFAFNQFMCFTNAGDVATFIGVSYAGFALVQLIVAATSPIKNGVFKLFQWVFWALIAIFAIVGA